MSSPKFAETHNVVAFLEKPAESNGFAEIINFLKASSVKTVNGVRQLQALIEKKKVIITEASIRTDLHLDDAEGTDCLPNTTIFEELAKMGYEKPSQKLTFYKAFFSPQWKFMIHTITQSLSAKTTAWNEFSSTMASLIICLATNRKFNLSKYIFDAMVKHLDGGVKFLMYPRFLHKFFINQPAMSHHKKIYVNPSHTKKFFANMKRAGKDFSGRITPLFDTMMVQASEEVGEDSDHPADSNHIPIVDQPSTSSQSKQKQKSKRKQRKEAEVAHDETDNEENIPTPSNDPLPSGEDSMQLNDLMVLCTQLQKQVLDLEKAKSDQAIEIASLKKRVDKLKKRRKFRTIGLKRLEKVGAARRIKSSNDSLGALEDASKQGRRIEDIDANAEVFVDVTTIEKDDQSTKIDDSTAGEAVTTAGVDDSTAGEAVTTASVEDSAAPIISTTVEETLAQTLMEIKAAKPKAKGIVFHDQEEQVTLSTVSVTQPSIKDKGKGIMQEPERPLKRKDQVAIDEDLARNIQAQLDAEIIKEERLKRQKQEEANIALIESWENTQAMMKANRLLAERLQTREREELTDEEKGKLFMELMEKRRKDFAALRAQEKRKRPPTKAQKRTQMSTYLKHMEVQESNEKKVEGNEEKVKSSRKKRLEVEADDTAELKKHFVFKKDDDIAIDAIPLATKPPMIVDYKLLKEGIMVHYQLIREDGSLRESSTVRMLQDYDRMTWRLLWKVSQTKHGAGWCNIA
ncbi:hypothetical protein Tco_1097329 [Tanacetum coccineum]